MNGETERAGGPGAAGDLSAAAAARSPRTMRVYDVLTRRLNAARAAEAEAWEQWKAEPEKLEVLHRHVRLTQRGNRLRKAALEEMGGVL